jgi:hypothetical protein
MNVMFASMLARAEFSRGVARHYASICGGGP